MRFKTFAAVAFALIFLAGSAYSQNQYFLPQIANGDFGGGSYRTTFILFNNTNTDTNALLELTDDGGNPLTLTIGGNTASSFAFQLPAGASQIVQTNGQGNVVVGAAKVTSAGNIGVSAIFSIFDSFGNFLTETGVGNSEPLSSFMLPVDTTGLFNTGLALFNTNSIPVTVTMTLRDTDGHAVGSPVTRNLAARNHLAIFISGPGQLFPAISNFQGTLLVQCSAPIAALVLRENTVPLSFTSLPGVSTTSTRRTLNLAQVANGNFGSGSYQTSFLIFNISASPANVVLTLTKDDGTPLSVTIPGRGTQSSFIFPNLAPGASLFLKTDGIGSVATGAATITSDVPVAASGVFTVLSPQGGFQTETGVGDSPVLTSFTLPVDITGTFDTGVAFFGAGGSSSTLTFRLLDATGTLVGSSATRNVAGNGHLALFVSQLFPGTSNFRGSVAVSSTSGVAALTLRQNASPLSFTTLPVLSGVSSGKPPGPVTPTSLLSKIELGVSATSNIVKDERLDAGFKLTGLVSGPGQAKTVRAVPSQGNSFGGNVDRLTGKYTIILPGGTYTLKVGVTPPGVPATESLTVIVDIPGSVQVSGDTTRDIALPSIQLFNVSGTVLGLNNLPPSSIPFQVLFDSNGPPAVTAQFTINKADGSYQGVLPSGNYAAGFVASILPPESTNFQIQTLGLLSLGSASISGNTTIDPLTVPVLAKLTGTVRGVGSPPFGPGVAVTAFDSSQMVTNTAVADVLTAQYEMVLAKGRTYNVLAGAAMLQGSTVVGSLAFPKPPASVSLNQDIADFDLTVPALPVQVTISGLVTDNSGKPLSGVLISAGSDSITGDQILTFANGTQTDAGGHYSMTVLSGTNYTISYTPPQ